MGPGNFRIEKAGLDSESAAALIVALNAELSQRYPEEGANHFRLEAGEVAKGKGAFYLGYENGLAVACGAVRLLDTATAEIKRMYVIPAARGHGLGRMMLGILEAEARRLGAERLVLETGERQHEAMALYQHAGFSATERFGEYLDSPLSVCMAKRLQA